MNSKPLRQNGCCHEPVACASISDMSTLKNKSPARCSHIGSIVVLLVCAAIFGIPLLRPLDVIRITEPVPVFFEELKPAGLTKYATVFGVPLLGHADTPDEFIRHAAHVSTYRLTQPPDVAFVLSACAVSGAYVGRNAERRPLSWRCLCLNLNLKCTKYSVPARFSAYACIWRG